MNQSVIFAKHTRFLTRDGLTLQAEHWGCHDAPLVLLVHGFPDTSQSWFGVADRLVAAGYQVLMPWLRGYTAASAMRWGRYDLLSCAEDLDAWCSALGQRQAHLVGHDWGAVLAQLAAHQRGGSSVQWLSISLLAIPAFYSLLNSLNALPSVPKQLKLSSYMAHLQSAHAWRWVSAHHAAWVENTWRRWSPSWAFSRDDIASARNAFSQPDIAWAATRYYRALFTPWQAGTRQAYALMRRAITQPLLLLAGRDDGCMHADFHRRLAQGLGTNAESRLLDGLGHFLQAENPRIVADEILAFIGAIDGVSN